MGDYRIEIINGVDGLERHAVAWDNLWQRSSVSNPGARAAMVRLWVLTFARGSFRAYTIFCGNRMVAALPTVRDDGRFIPGEYLPVNDWSPCGDLMVDLSANLEVIGQLMLRLLQNSRSQRLVLSECRVDRIGWRMLLSTCDRAGFTPRCTAAASVGTITVRNGDWSAHEARLSKNLRKQLRRANRKLSELGKVDFRYYNQICPSDAKALLMEAMKIEHRSWKGRAGTSMLSDVRIKNFYLEQSELLAGSRELVFAFLHLNDQPMAFEYGWLSKKTYHSFKVGYDDTFGQFSPGHLILKRLVQRFSEDENVHTIDAFGPTQESFTRWQSDSYVIKSLRVPLGKRAKFVNYLKNNIRPLTRRHSSAVLNQGYPQ